MSAESLGIQKGSGGGVHNLPWCCRGVVEFGDVTSKLVGSRVWQGIVLLRPQQHASLPSDRSVRKSACMWALGVP